MDALLAILLAVLGITLLSAIVAVILVLFGLRRLRRRNQVSPDQPSDAPLGWLWSPAGAARLHRRLRAAVSVGRAISTRHGEEPDPPAAVEMAAALEREAVALDHKLTQIGRLPQGERRRLVPLLAVEVRRVEELVSRLTLLDLDAAATVRLPGQLNAMEELAEQLDQQEKARRVLREAEAKIGLHAEPPLPTPAAQHSQARRRARG